MRKYLAKDENFKTVLVKISHDSLLQTQGGDGYSYYHISQDGYDFLIKAQQMPNEDGYLLYSSSSGEPIWQKEVEPIVDHSLLLGIQGGSGEDGYYHLIESEYVWLTDGYNDGYWGVDKGGTGFVTYDEGDLLIGSSSNELDKLSAGTENQVLTISSGSVVWGDLNVTVNHNELEAIQGGSGEDGYYHLTEPEHIWLTDGYNDGYWGTDKGGTGFVTYDEGDLLIGSSSNELDKLSVGTEDQILTVSGGNIVWSDSSVISNHNELEAIQGGSGEDGYYHLTESEHIWLTDGYNDGYWGADKGGTGFVTYDEGDLLIGSSSNELDKLSIGEDGYKLVSNDGLVFWSPGYYNVVFAGKLGSLSSSFDGYILTNLSTSTVDDFPVFVPPIDSYLRNLSIKVNQAPGVGEDVTTTVRKNAENTDLAVIISGTDIEGTNTSSLISVSAGDKISIRVETSSGSVVENLSSSFLAYPRNQ